VAGTRDASDGSTRIGAGSQGVAAKVHLKEGGGGVPRGCRLSILRKYPEVPLKYIIMGQEAPAWRGARCCWNAEAMEVCLKSRVAYEP
jgi:hypothetical protein